MSKIHAAYRHREAYCLMWYKCVCGHTERIWNSRDGVTPFMTSCPSCGQMSLTHAAWHLDQCAPSHTPNIGQRVWIDLTMERARAVAKVQATTARACGRDLPDDFEEQIAKHIFNGGGSPDLQVYGWKIP